MLAMSLSGISQEPITDKKQKIGITFSSLGKSMPIQFESLEGFGSYGSDEFFTVGVNYIRPINSWLKLETGLEYSKHSVYFNPFTPPNVDAIGSKENISIINIPAALRATFLKYLFINSGLLVDIDLSKPNGISSQNGIGTLLGLGFNYDFDKGMSVSINPYIKAHSLISTSSDRYPERLMESGLRMGIAFSF